MDQRVSFFEPLGTKIIAYRYIPKGRKKTIIDKLGCISQIWINEVDYQALKTLTVESIAEYLMKLRELRHRACNNDCEYGYPGGDCTCACQGKNHGSRFYE